MKASFTLLLWAVTTSVALAAPKPVAQDFAEVLAALPEPVAGESGPPIGDDVPPPPPPVPEEIIEESVASFVENDAAITKRAQIEARVTAPEGFYTVFTGLTGATEHSSYKTYKTLTSYSPEECTSWCVNNLTGCTFVNLYKEHVDAETTFIKCSAYSQFSSAASATNVGQWRNGYLVTISESNGYARRIEPQVEGWCEEPLDGAINGKRELPTDPDPYMGFTTITAADPALCAAVCEEKTAYNSRHPSDGKYRACNFFNFYLLLKNGEGYQTVCSFYLIPFDASYATNTGYTSGANKYTVVDSWAFTRDIQQGEGGIVTV